MLQKWTTLACLASVIALPAFSQNDSRIAISGGVGTTGGTLEAQVKLNDFFTLSGGANAFKFDVDESVEDIDYTGEFDFSGANAFVQLHPFRSSFMLIGGVYAGTKEISLEARPTTDVEIGDDIFTPEEVGSLTGGLGFADAAPFAGIGFDNTFTKPRGFGFRLYAGAAFLGDSEVTLESTGGTLSNDPTLTAELEREKANVEDEIDAFGVYPVVQAAITYRF